MWKARDTRPGRTVAIKLLPAEFAKNAHLRLRLEREARAISQLNHPSICTLHDMVTPESLADRSWRVSAAGGSRSSWSADARTIYFTSGNRLYNASFKEMPAVSVSAPVPDVRRLAAER